MSSERIAEYFSIVPPSKRLFNDVENACNSELSSESQNVEEPTAASTARKLNDANNVCTRVYYLEIMTPLDDFFIT
jgi:hypothetical protein